MRIANGDTGRVVYFVAVDVTDLKTREASLTNVDVWYSVDGGSSTQMTTPTVTVVDATNQPGVFKLAIDESGMVAVPSGVDEVELVLHIEATEMSPVTRVIEVFRPKITAGSTSTAQTGDAYAVVAHADHGNAKLVRSTTPGNALDVSGTGEAGLDFNNIKDAAAPKTLTNITVPVVTSITNGVTVATNSDKTGYSIAGTKTTLDALNDITAASVWAVATRSITGGAIDTNGDKTVYRLSATGGGDIHY